MAKNEFDSTDAQPVVAYGKDGTTPTAVRVDAAGNVCVVDGSVIPVDYDSKEYGYTGTDLTTIVYKLGAATVMTKTISYTAHIITGIVIT